MWEKRIHLNDRNLEELPIGKEDLGFWNGKTAWETCLNRYVVGPSPKKNCGRTRGYLPKLNNQQRGYTWAGGGGEYRGFLRRKLRGPSHRCPNVKLHQGNSSTRMGDE